MMVRVLDRPIGPGHPVYVIAEISANHNQDYALAEELVREAIASGADAIKVQTYRPETLTLDSDAPWFRIDGTIWEGERLFSLYERAYMPWEWHQPLQELCRQKGVHFFSTPFDATAVDYLQSIDVPAFKIASFELVHLPLLRKVAATGKPIILSTGMATLGEIEEAVATLHAAGAADLVLLRCNSGYPAPLDEMDLRAIEHLQGTFCVPVGLSDHSLRLEVPITAVALGACVIEKHFTLRRADGGPDATFSLEPAEFRAMVEAVRNVPPILGRARYGPSPAERASARFRPSIFVVRDLPDGHVLTTDDVRVLRPSAGLHPRYYEQVVGMVTNCALTRGTPLQWGMVRPHADPDALVPPFRAPAQ